MKPTFSPARPRGEPRLAARLAGSAVRHALLGAAVAAASLPLVSALAHRLGLARPPLDSLLLLAGSVVLAFAGGGLLGTALAARGAGRRTRPLAALAGLVWGIGLCAAVLPLYVDGVLDDLSESGAQVAATQAVGVLDHPSGALRQLGDTAGELAQEGATGLPALVLLVWVLVGPAVVAPLEARPRRDGRAARGISSRPASRP